jgi:hypothetical protein
VAYPWTPGKVRYAPNSYQYTYATCCEQCEMLTTSRDVTLTLLHRSYITLLARRSPGLLQQARHNVLSASKYKANCFLRLCGVLPSFPARHNTFVCLLTTSSSSISGKDSVRCFIRVTFILRTFNSVFGLTLLNFPLNRCACLTISVYILWTEVDEIMK